MYPVNTDRCELYEAELLLTYDATSVVNSRKLLIWYSQVFEENMT
jgi:hypothetical protein